MKTTQEKIYEKIIKDMTRISNVGKVTFNNNKHLIECKKYEYYLSIWVLKNKIKLFVRINTMSSNEAFNYVYCEDTSDVDIKGLTQQLIEFVTELSILKYYDDYYEEMPIKDYSYINMVDYEMELKALPIWNGEPTATDKKVEYEWHKKTNN